ncbi:histidine kinase [Chryseobacterium phosphatilyticum]|uniref:Histidine kinase n=1 Tax=Chryseobacterium phosphatilyticum TaxID=475075 RepID=A0A316XMQ1_9FLAO|nr:sensor histidine kinase [Chryseobacterium phosphatilyticum]PWN72220.1 histidine kinase [Chryseobacterium phosphatilyticum]
MMKSNAEPYIRQNLYFQLSFWSALFLFVTVRTYGEYDPGFFKESVIYNFCHWIFQIVGANFIYYILIRHFFDRKKYSVFSVYLLLSLYFISVINRLFIVYVAEPFFIDEPKDSILSIFTDIKYLLIHYTFPIISGAFIFISILFIIRYKEEKENTARLQKEKSELELQSLKSQLHPHFLFNTLNNIYSLSVSNSDKTSQSISQLSDILDYILHKGPQKWVSISEELAVIDDLIALESLRYSEERLKISTKTVLNSSNFIPPLLYLTLVENTFKHGAGKNPGCTEIDIEVETNHNRSLFRISNTYNRTQLFNEKGIGLQNIKRQLQHHYQEDFVFKISQENNIFTIEIITPSTYD